MSVGLDNPPAEPTPTAPAPAVPPLYRTVIEPSRNWEWVNWAELWRYRELLFFLAWRDVKVRYKQTSHSMGST